VQGGSAMIFLFMEEKNSERERERYNFLSTSYCPSTFCPLVFLGGKSCSRAALSNSEPAVKGP